MQELVAECNELCGNLKKKVQRVGGRMGGLVRLLIDWRVGSEGGGGREGCNELRPRGSVSPPKKLHHIVSSSGAFVHNDVEGVSTISREVVDSRRATELSAAFSSSVLEVEDEEESAQSFLQVRDLFRKRDGPKCDFETDDNMDVKDVHMHKEKNVTDACACGQLCKKTTNCYSVIYVKDPKSKNHGHCRLFPRGHPQMRKSACCTIGYITKPPREADEEKPGEKENATAIKGENATTLPPKMSAPTPPKREAVPHPHEIFFFLKTSTAKEDVEVTYDGASKKVTLTNKQKEFVYPLKNQTKVEVMIKLFDTEGLKEHEVIFSPGGNNFNYSLSLGKPSGEDKNGRWGPADWHCRVGGLSLFRADIG